MAFKWVGLAFLICENQVAQFPQHTEIQYLLLIQFIHSFLRSFIQQITC